MHLKDFNQIQVPFLNFPFKFVYFCRFEDESNLNIQICGFVVVNSQRWYCKAF